jgi:hypothetical protein
LTLKLNWSFLEKDSLELTEISDIIYPNYRGGEIAVKVLVSLSDELYARMQAVIPPRQRSRVVSVLLEEEVRRRERELYECALAVEQDEQLHAEMAEWGVTVGDGIETETW